MTIYQFIGELGNILKVDTTKLDVYQKYDLEKLFNEINQEEVIQGLADENEDLRDEIADLYSRLNDDDD